MWESVMVRRELTPNKAFLPRSFAYWVRLWIICASRKNSFYERSFADLSTLLSGYFSRRLVPTTQTSSGRPTILRPCGGSTLQIMILDTEPLLQARQGWSSDLFTVGFRLFSMRCTWEQGFSSANDGFLPLACVVGRFWVTRFLNRWPF